ncbi:MAG: MmcB family DNA repair protein [Rhodospirillales bacterium]
MEHIANIDVFATPAANMQKGAPALRCGSASLIVRGVLRLLMSLDYRTLTEFPLPNGRRVDVAALDGRGGFAIVEVKSSVADFRADGKWPGYRAFCDSFYFAVDAPFPLAVLPDDVGLIVADGFEGAVVRPSPVRKLNGVRRRALLLRFGRTAAMRLSLLADPDGGGAGRG